jgi:hypothetical protein
MKTSSIIASFVLLLTFALRAQTYSIENSTIAAGGGVSSNGQYTLNATIGQPAAGTMSNGNYSLTSGFWAVAIQTEGAPGLTITVAAGNAARISWPLPGTGWSLESATALTGSSSDWSLVSAGQYSTNASDISITVQPPTGRRFYRLHK